MNSAHLLPIDLHTPLTRDGLADVLGHLRNAGGAMFRDRTQDHIIQTLAGISRCWCLKTYSLRRRALDLLPKTTGLSRQNVERGIDLTFSKITAEVLADYVNEELGSSNAPSGRLIAHVAPGNLFPPIVQSLFHGLLVRSPCFIRSSEHDPNFPVLLAQSLIDADSQLAHALAVAHWSSANIGLNRTLARTSDTLVVYGSDETLAEWKGLMPENGRFIGFGHRLSVGFISKDGLKRTAETAAAAALDTALFDQQGCLSPHCFYLENPTLKEWIGFGGRLAEELRRLESEIPMGPLSADMEFVVGNLRQKYLFLSSQEPESYKTWFSRTSGWTVIYDANPELTPSCLHRTIWLRPAPGLGALGEILMPWKGKLQCLGTDLPHEALHTQVPKIRELGLTRICALGSMQAPPITWPNGGISLLKQLTT